MSVNPDCRERQDAHAIVLSPESRGSPRRVFGLEQPSRLLADCPLEGQGGSSRSSDCTESQKRSRQQRTKKIPEAGFFRRGRRNSFPEPEVLGRETWLTVLGITLWGRMLIQSDRHNRDTICDIWNADPRLGSAHRKMLRGYNFETHGRSSPPTECAYQRVGAGFASSRNASVAGRSCETSIRNRARLRSELLFVSGQQSSRRGS